MSLLQANFDELIERIRRGRELGHAGFEPIYYLIFEPKKILEVKRKTPFWTARLRNEGWEVHCFSIATEIEEILQNDPRRALWLLADRKAPQNWQKANQSLANALTNGAALQKRLEDKLASLKGQSNAVVIVTDLEALHPYLRIGAIETQLQGKFNIPYSFFVPWRTRGQDQLKIFRVLPGHPRQ